MISKLLEKPWQALRVLAKPTTKLLRKPLPKLPLKTAHQGLNFTWTEAVEVNNSSYTSDLISEPIWVIFSPAYIIRLPGEPNNQWILSFKYQ